MEVTTRRRSIGGVVRALVRHPKAWAVMSLVVLVAGPWAWWATQLWGLPDIGDPFDVAAFETVRVPDDRNAFLVYAEATSLCDRAFRSFREAHPDSVGGKMPLEWAKADQPWRDHLADQRANLELWRVGSERPDARHDHAEGLSFHTILDLNQRLKMLARLAILEASRLEAEGDMAGAWGWYRAVFRSSRHNGRHGFLLERAIGAAMHENASEPLTRWAADPRVDAPLLRRALDEFLAIDATSPPLSDALKMEYLVFRNSLHDPSLIGDLLIQKQKGDPTDWCDDLPVSASHQAADPGRQAVRGQRPRAEPPGHPPDAGELAGAGRQAPGPPVEKPARGPADLPGRPGAPRPP